MTLRQLRYGLIAPLLYVSWLAMMAIHEVGHVLHAWMSGGRVSSVHFALFDFSRTELSINPHPQFVAWGGPLWGALLPLAAWALLHRIHVKGLGPILCFFAGFCLIVNGGYIGLGWINGAGDAGTLLRHGAPAWMMLTSGVSAMVGGLLLWHRLGLRALKRSV